MTFYYIQLTASPSQTVDTTLNNQFVSLFIQSRENRLYADVYVDNVPVVIGRVCQNQKQIINESYRGFKGKLFFIDREGSEDPEYKGLNSRYQLIYWDGENEQEFFAENNQNNHHTR